MTEQKYFNNNIGLLPLNNDNMKLNQLQNNPNIQLNNYKNISPYVETNLNINKFLLLNSNNNNSNINLNNQFNQDMNDFSNNKNKIYNTIQNNYYINNNNNYFQSTNNNKIIKPHLSSKDMLLASPSLTKANDLIFKDLPQLDNFLTNYKYYFKINGYDAIDICLKYILEVNFFFNQVVTNKIQDIFKVILYPKDSNDETFKSKIKEVFQKMIPFNIKEEYLKEYFKHNSEKYLYNLFKKDLNINKNYKDKLYYLSEIFETVKYKLNNKDREEIKNIFNKYIYVFNNQNFNNTSYINNDYFNNLSLNKNGGYYSNNNSFNNNYNNKHRKHSFQSSANNWKESNYNNNNYINGNINNYHQHNNHNYNNNNDKNNDELGYNKAYNSSFHKKNNYKGSYLSRHYYSEKNNNKNKSNRKNSAYGTGSFLVEVSTTPKKEDDENNEENNLNKNHSENKDNIKEEEKNNINSEVKENDKKGEDDNNEEIKNNAEDKKEEDNIILIDKVNISQEMPKEEDIDEFNKSNDLENGKDEKINQENINSDIKKDNDMNIFINFEEKDKIDPNNKNENNQNNLEFPDDNILNDFNSLNPFNDNNKREDEIASDKEDSSNNLRTFKSAIETEKLNIDKDNEENNSEDNNENNDYIMNIINNPENIFNTINTNEEDNKEENIEHNELNNEIIVNNEKINNENECHENKIINRDSNLRETSPKKELFSNSANNINERINLNNNNNKNNNETNLTNLNNNNSTSISDNNLMNLNKRNIQKNTNNINLNDNILQNNINNINLTNEQLQLFRMFMQNNNSLLNTNLSKANLNNNILANANNIGINIINNINSGINLLNQFNDNLFNINNNYNGVYNLNNDNQNYINIFYNYLDQNHDLLSELKPNSKNKNMQYNNQYNLDFLKLKSDKITKEFNTKVKKLRENNPSLVKENMNLFEEKIILPLYQKICEENQEIKDIYTNVYEKYRNIIMKILEKNNVGDTTIEPYGSIVNNFLTENGDIDICLVPSDLNLISNFDTYLEEIKEEIVNNQKCAKFVILENYSKFLILKLKDIESGIDLDITVQSILPITNTKLIRLYSLYDQRFHILGIFLKFWVKKNHIHGSLDKYLSSYALLLLIIHYLQTIVEPKILPILQQVKNIKKEYAYINVDKEITTNLYFEEDLDEIKKYMKIVNCNDDNECSVVELLVGFFEYYTYKYDHYMISISRSDKIPVEENETIAFPLEDPFDIGYNPGKSMKLNTLPYTAFIYCMKKELNNILSGEYFKYNGE